MQNATLVERIHLKKDSKGLNTIGEGMGEFMQRESKAINKITKNVEKGGKNSLKSSLKQATNWAKELGKHSIT